MSYLVLARKYRPQTFDDVVGQSHVTRTLSNAISAGRLAHAILFAGPRGTGKTTTARILAKAMNCERGPTPTPCNQCSSCLDITRGGAADVHEIDGASNNGVDHVRELRENARYMPVSGRHKIYIIDEVHMLSTAAFNALLKTLEEPPAHVLFFFATTEVHKIPITILSRCQRHDLRRVPADAIAAHLRSLCLREGMNLPEESIWAITRQAAGSIRDGLSLLDQVLGGLQGDIDHQRVLDLLGVAGQHTLFGLSAAVLERDTARALAIIDEVYRSGQDVKAFYGAVVTHFRNLLVVKVAGPRDALVEAAPEEREYLVRQAAVTSDLHLIQLVDALLREENVIRHALQARVALELAVLRLLSLRPAVPIGDLVQRLERLADRAPGSPDIETPPASPPDDLRVPCPPVPPAFPPSPRLAEPSGETPVSAPEAVVVSPPAPLRAEPSSPVPIPREIAPPVETVSTLDMEVVPEIVSVAPVPSSKLESPVDITPEPAPDFPPRCAEPTPEYGGADSARQHPDEPLEVIWNHLVEAIDADSPALGSVVRKSRLVAMEGNLLRVEVPGGAGGLSRVLKKRAVIETAASRYFGRPMTVKGEAAPVGTAAGERPENRPAPSSSVGNSVVADAVDIFQATVVNISPLSSIDRRST